MPRKKPDPKVNAAGQKVPRQSDRTKAVRLTGKQQKFCEKYVGEAKRNATEAARLAGYSDVSAGMIGCENLTKPKIIKEIQRMESILASMGGKDQLPDKLHAFWTGMWADPDNDDRTRLSAAKDQAKALGMQSGAPLVAIQNNSYLPEGCSAEQIAAAIVLDKTKK
jgi:hypothetical protein